VKKTNFKKLTSFVIIQFVFIMYCFNGMAMRTIDDEYDIVINTKLETGDLPEYSISDTTVKTTIEEGAITEMCFDTTKNSGETIQTRLLLFNESESEMVIKANINGHVNTLTVDKNSGLILDWQGIESYLLDDANSLTMQINSYIATGKFNSGAMVCSIAGAWAATVHAAAWGICLGPWTGIAVGLGVGIGFAVLCAFA